MLKKKIGFLFMMLLALSLFSGITGCSFRVQTSFGSEGGVQVGKTFYYDGVCLPVLYSYQQIYEKNYGITDGGNDAFTGGSKRKRTECGGKERKIRQIYHA